MTVIAGALRTAVLPVDRLTDAAARLSSQATGASVALRHVGTLTSRQEVADRIQSQLLIKRQLRAAWLREQQRMDIGNGMSSTPFASGNALPHASALMSPSARQMVTDYGQFLSGHPIHLCLNMAHRSPFLSRRQVAERILSRFYGLSGKSLEAEIEAIVLSSVENQSGGGGQGGAAGGGGGGAGHSAGGQQHDGGNREEADRATDGHEVLGSIGKASAAGNREQPAVEGLSPKEKLSADLKAFLVAELALTSPNVTAEKKLVASGLKSHLLSSDGSAIEAAHTLAMVAVERAEDSQPVTSDRQSMASALSGSGLHEVCNYLLSLHPPESVMKAIAALINSVEVLGHGRAFRQEGVALSECLTRMRNLSVIMLIMEKTERLKSRLLFGLNTGKLPSDESIWRSICKMTSSRSVEPLLNILQEGDMSPLVKRTFIQELMGILRDLPISVWPDKDSRSNILSSMGDLTSLMVPARSTGK